MAAFARGGRAEIDLAPIALAPVAVPAVTLPSAWPATTGIRLDCDNVGTGLQLAQPRSRRLYYQFQMGPHEFATILIGQGRRGAGRQMHE